MFVGATCFKNPTTHGYRFTMHEGYLLFKVVIYMIILKQFFINL